MVVQTDRSKRRRRRRSASRSSNIGLRIRTHESGKVARGKGKLLRMTARREPRRRLTHTQTHGHTHHCSRLQKPRRHHRPPSPYWQTKTIHRHSSYCCCVLAFVTGAKIIIHLRGRIAISTTTTTTTIMMMMIMMILSVASSCYK